MNCEQLNNIPLEMVFSQYGMKVIRFSSKNRWYKNPFFEERTASLQLIADKNIWRLYSECGRNKTVTDFLLRMENFNSISELLQWAECQNFLKNSTSSFSFKQKYDYEILTVVEDKPKYSVDKICTIYYDKLKNYLKSRRVLNHVNFLRQIHFTMYGTKYFGVGLRNDSGVWEVSFQLEKNAENGEKKFENIKRCLGKKDITTIKNNGRNLCVFEAFFDCFSYQNTFGKDVHDEDFIILNTTSMAGKIKEKIERYKNVFLYLDNDKSGDDATKLITEFKSDCIDMRYLYKDNSDLNDYLVGLY